MLHPSARQICDVVDRRAGELFSSELVLTHADIHNENVFLSGTEGSRSCQFIDWETARIEPLELDFVHPFLNILGEAFPGRRLDAEVRSGPDNDLLNAFDISYGQRIRWDHVAIHGVATYLDWAFNAHRKNQLPLRDFYLHTGIGGLEFVGLVGTEDATKYIQARKR
ncbi:MAG: phosphotransferase [Pseudomonadota bacterium]|nr:phosphotransferase [Pseudomonadota bacterium]